MVRGQHAVLKVFHPQSWPRDPCNPSVTVYDAPCREPVYDCHGNTEVGHDHLQGDFRTSDPSHRKVEGSERVAKAQEDHVLGLFHHSLTVSLDCHLLCYTLALAWVSAPSSLILKMSTTITQALAQGTDKPGPKRGGFGYG